ncbi:UNVERIFIED_ORG: hypothetical protein M2348_000693 [Sphingomonas sp. R1F5B]
MSEAHREEFLHVAYQTLAHLPPDLFVDAARSARVCCKHPAQVVPHIAAHAAERQALRDRLKAGQQSGLIADHNHAPRTWWRPDAVELARAKAEVAAAIAAGAKPTGRTMPEQEQQRARGDRP